MDNVSRQHGCDRMSNTKAQSFPVPIRQAQDRIRAFQDTFPISSSGYPAFRFVSTPLLRVAYLEWGRQDAPVIIALHGFPDDAGAWHGLGVRLAAKGYRVLAPYLRGSGPTHFRSKTAKRSGQLAELAMDAIAFADRLGVARFQLVGHNLGARIAQAISVIAPERVVRLISLWGYALFGAASYAPVSRVTPRTLYPCNIRLPLRRGYLTQDPHGFAWELWSLWSPLWPEDARALAFHSAAQSFENPDFVSVALSSHGLSMPHVDSDGAVPASCLAGWPAVTVPTVILEGGADGHALAGRTAKLDEHLFHKLLGRHVFPGIGHWLHREDPGAIAAFYASARGSE
jgi:pimeloyl-ACP methyl ester carboxylesterase